MSDKEPSAPAVSEAKKGNSLDWLWPAIAAVVIGRLLGVVGGLITFGAYYWLKPKLGTWRAVAIAAAIGVFAAIALGAMLRA